MQNSDSGLQVVPHRPQLRESMFVSVHVPPQHSRPASQLLLAQQTPRRLPQATQAPSLPQTVPLGQTPGSDWQEPQRPGPEASRQASVEVEQQAWLPQGVVSSGQAQVDVSTSEQTRLPRQHACPHRLVPAGQPQVDVAASEQTSSPRQQACPQGRVPVGQPQVAVAWL